METSIPSKNEWDLTYGPLSKLELLDTQVEGSVQWVLLEISWIHCWEFSTISRENNQWIAPRNGLSQAKTIAERVERVEHGTPSDGSPKSGSFHEYSVLSVVA